MPNYSVLNCGTDSSGRPIYMTAYMRDWWAGVVKRLGFTPTIVQGAFMARNGGGAKASAGYHDQGGCIDIRVWDIGEKKARKVVRECRRSGAAAWLRDKQHGGMDPHIHIVLGTDKPLASGAANQWQQYLRGLDGLASGGKDYHWRPSPLVTTPPQPAPKPKPAPAPLPAPDCEDRVTLRVGTANLEHGRPSSAVARELAALLPKVDVLICNEAEDYTAVLTRLDGWTWHAGKGQGRGQTGILARTDLGGEFSLPRGSEQGWFTTTGRRTPPKWLPCLDLGTVRIIGVHMPPSVERGGRHVPSLPVRRWAVFKEQMTALTKLIGRNGPVIVGGDFNVDATADKGGKWFPRYQLAHLGLRRDANVRGTHGKRVIDNLWARDVVLTGTELGPKTGSDHRAVICTYEVEKP